MPTTLVLAIDARRAKQGADEFSQATRQAGQSAGDAAKRTTELEKGLERTAVRSKEASRGASDLSRGTRELSASEREAEVSALRLAAATDKTAESRRRHVDAVRASIEAERRVRSNPPPVSQIPTGTRGAEVLGGFQTLGSQLGPVGGQLAAFTGQAQSAGFAIGEVAGSAGLGSAALIGLGGAFTASAAAAVGAISANFDFQRSLTGLNALLDSNAQLEERRQSIYAQGTRTGIALEDLAKGQEILTRLFQDDAKAVDDIARAAEKFSKAAGVDYAGAAQVLGSTIEAFRLNAGQASQVAASLFQSARNAKQPFLEFSSALSTLGDEARSAGVDFSELSEVLAQAASETNTGEATQAVKRFLIAINDEADPATQKLRDLGVRFDDLPQGAGRLVGALERIKAATAGRFDIVSSIFGSRDVSTVFAAIAGDLDKVGSRAAAARLEVEKFNATVQRQKESPAARFDAAVGASLNKGKEFGGEILDASALKYVTPLVPLKILLGDAVDLFRNLGEEAEVAAVKVASLTPPPLSEFDKAVASIRKLGEKPPELDLDQSAAIKSARASYDAFRDQILSSRPVGFPIEVAVESQSAEVRKAFDTIRAEIEGEGLQFNVIGPEFKSQVQTLEEAAKQIQAASKAKGEALTSDAGKTNAGRDAVDAYRRSLESEAGAIGLSARELATLRVQRDAERIAAAAGLTLREAEIQKLRELAAANFDAADASKKRTDAEARSTSAQAGYKEYVDTLREEVRLLQLSPEERAVDEGVRRAQTLADAYREAQRALGADPRTVENLVPDQTFTIEQIRELILRIQELKALQSESPVSRYGPFIPDQPSPDIAPVEPFGPEFDEGAARAQQRLEELQGSIGRERDLLGLSNDERERALFLRDVEGEAIRAGVQDIDALVGAMGREFEEFQRLRDLDQLGKDFGRTLASGFEDAIFQAKSFNDALRDIGREIAQLAFRQFVTKPLTDSLGGLFSGLLGAGAGGGGGGGSGGIFAQGGVFSRGDVVPFAMGGAFDRGHVIPFAGGGVFDQPSYFPMSGGRTGLLGEAGPEAIMPLTRGADGKLGVQAQAPASQPVVNNTTHVSMTVVTQNADSFKKSSAQITRDLKKRL